MRRAAHIPLPPKSKKMSACELSKLAYSKIILHALKYPHTAINGILLAPEGSNSHSLKYVDAIPLFHHNLGLTPMLEVALMQVIYILKCDPQQTDT